MEKQLKVLQVILPACSFQKQQSFSHILKVLNSALGLVSRQYKELTCHKLLPEITLTFKGW